MNATIILAVVIIYFLLLLGISFLTGRKADNSSFFTGNRKSPWAIVAFGMIGASLSGVTFLSIPGAVSVKSFTYMQIVLGYLLGYIAVANILLPLYYRLNLTSIYTYLDKRLGNSSYKTGASFFLISRVIGASFRLFLVAMVLDRFVLSTYGIPFWATVAITIVLIWIYSFRAGIKTIVWTDTLQTFFMLTAVILVIIVIARELNLSFSGVQQIIKESHYSTLFEWDWKASNHFFKDFLSGAFITIAMTGLDQDMMQKNLTCKNIKQAKTNMYWMSSSLLFINFIFLCLGALLYIFAVNKGVLVENLHDSALMSSGCPVEMLSPLTQNFDCYTNDMVFPFLSFQYLPPLVGIVFVLGLVAAAYSSADSALTSLTTSFCIDFLGFKSPKERVYTRYIVHIAFSVILFATIIIFSLLNNESVIYELFKVASYTYGPLLGLFGFGLFTTWMVKDKWVPAIAVLSPLICYLLNHFSERIFNGYVFGFELLIINGLLMAFGLFIIRKKK